MRFEALFLVIALIGTALTTPINQSKLLSTTHSREKFCITNIPGTDEQARDVSIESSLE